MRVPLGSLKSQEKSVRKYGFHIYGLYVPGPGLQWLSLSLFFLLYLSPNKDIIRLREIIDE